MRLPGTGDEALFVRFTQIRHVPPHHAIDVDLASTRISKIPFEPIKKLKHRPTEDSRKRDGISGRKNNREGRKATWLTLEQAKLAEGTHVCDQMLGMSRTGDPVERRIPTVSKGRQLAPLIYRVRCWARYPESHLQEWGPQWPSLAIMLHER